MSFLNNCSEGTKQMISLKSYSDLQPYWDYQRKIEYNKEQLFDYVERVVEDSIEFNEEYVTDSRDEIHLDRDELFVYLWNQIDTAEMMDPPQSWIPKNPQYQIEGEAQN
jgi:hypothetical protein